MIQVSLTTLLLLGMVIGVALLGALWVLAIWRERRAEARTRQGLVACRVCGTVYEKTPAEGITACPQCATLNEATRPRPI